MNKVGIESGCSTSLDDMLINIESSLLTNNSVFESYGLSSGINLNIKKLFRTFMDLLIRDIVMDDIAFEYGNEDSRYFMRIEIKPISGDTYYNIMNSSDSARKVIRYRQTLRYIGLRYGMETDRRRLQKQYMSHITISI